MIQKFSALQLAPGTWINPHKSLLGLGNYDVNVLMSALQSRGYEAKWFDKRKPLSILVLDNIFGFVLNVPSNFRVVGIVPLPFLKQKHWIALRSVGSTFYNLDSNLKKPEELGKVCHMRKSYNPSELSLKEPAAQKRSSRDTEHTNRTMITHFRSASFLLSLRCN